MLWRIARFALGFATMQKMKCCVALVIGLLVPAAVFAQTPTAASSLRAASGPLTKAALAGKTLFATFETTEGNIVVLLFSKDAPKTVANFVGLAAGEKEFMDPAKNVKAKRAYYNGVVFHRVIPGFMIQGGDPLGMGIGGPGYQFEDEFQSGRGFDKVGLLAMANSGPNTNGSQFFITTSMPTYLNNRHTVFGEVIAGYEVVERISQVARDGNDKPLTPVTIKNIKLSDKAPSESRVQTRSAQQPQKTNVAKP
jgi:peptidyl-prolyl cis-trans isomerase A (cyclophilin A)